MSATKDGIQDGEDLSELQSCACTGRCMPVAEGADAFNEALRAYTESVECFCEMFIRAMGHLRLSDVPVVTGVPADAPPSGCPYQHLRQRPVSPEPGD